MPWLSISYLAEITGVTTRTVRKRCEGLETRQGDKNATCYNSLEALPKILGIGEKPKIGRAEPESETEALALSREQALFTREKRIAAEIANARDAGELLPMTVMQWTLERITTEIRSIFESIPMNVKRAAPDLPASVIDKIKREVIKGQNAAADYRVDIEAVPEELWHVSSGRSRTTPTA